MSLEPFATSARPPAVSRSGGDLLAPITLIANPVSNDEAATKQYADATISLLASGFQIRIMDRWYLPSMYEGTFSVGGVANLSYCNPRFVGAPMTWSRCRVCGAGIDDTGLIEVGLYELNDSDLRPTGAPIYRSGLVTPTVNAKTKAGATITNTHDETLPAGVRTTSRWVGFAVYTRQAKGLNYSPGGINGYFLFGARQSDTGFGGTLWEQTGLTQLPSSGVWTVAGNGFGTAAGVPRIAFMPSAVG